MSQDPLTGSLLAGLPAAPLSDEVFESLATLAGVRIERIVSTGQTTPDGAWYDQAWDEWVVVIAGSARVRIDGEAEDRVLAAGDWLLLPAGCRHRVTHTRTDPPTVWLALHGPQD